METRVRRGKTVVIPEQWVGKTTNKQTIRKRRSKQSKAARKVPAHRLKDGTYPTEKYVQHKRRPALDKGWDTADSE